MTTDSDLFQEVVNLATRGDVEQAFDKLVALEEIQSLPLYFLVLKVRLGLLLKHDCIKYSLDAAHSDLKKALEIDDMYVDALIEMGNIQLELSDPIRAKQFFEKAVSISRRQLSRSVWGIVDCLLITNGREEAISYFKSMIASPMDEDNITDISNELSINDEPLNDRQ